MVNKSRVLCSVGNHYLVDVGDNEAALAFSTLSMTSYQKLFTARTDGSTATSVLLEPASLPIVGGEDGNDIRSRFELTVKYNLFNAWFTVLVRRCCRRVHIGGPVLPQLSEAKIGS